MSKFICVRELPETLRKDECIILAPNFIEEAHASSMKRSRSKVTTLGFLKEMVGNVANHFDLEREFDVFSDIPYSDYEGIFVESTEQMSKLVLRMFLENWPRMLDKYMDYHIKNRPRGVKYIFFNGPLSETSAFSRHGIEAASKAEVDQVLKKTKKSKVEDELETVIEVVTPEVTETL